MTRIDTDPDERVGLLTQAGLLAGHADALDSSPIHRGAFIQKRVLCTVFGPLPADLGELPPRSGEIVTTRDQVEAKTAPDGCQSCHRLINPAGFALEAFDTLGRVRERDNGAPVDTAASIALDGETVEFEGAVELAYALADSETVRRCYETQWFRYALGRGERQDDLCLLSRIDEATQQGDGRIKELLVALATSRGFRFRAQEDL